MRRREGRSRRLGPAPRNQYAADDPRAYGTPVWWHDPDVAASITKDGSNRVSSMLDLGTGAVDVTNGGAVGTWPTWQAAALNGKAILRFVNQTLNKALGAALLGTDWTVFAVVSNAFTLAGTTNGSFLRQGHVANNTGLDLTWVTGARTVTCKGVQVHTGGTMTNDTFEVWQLERINGAPPTLKINGSTDALSGASVGYNTGANTFDYGISANGARLAFCCAFNSTGISSAFAAALKTKYGL